jgi:anti-sigma factor RsiW
MNTTLEIKNINTVCYHTDVAALVPEYFTGQLEEALAETVERHLADCNECRERYLTLIRVQGEAQKGRLINSQNNGHRKRRGEVELANRKKRVR